MVRTQIQLTEEQSRILKAMARERKVSMANLIRQSIDRFIHSAHEPTMEEKRQRALSIVGKYAAGETDLGVGHDRYLAEIYGETGK